MQITTRRITTLALMMLMVIAVSTSGAASPIQAETGKGTDVFKVILSLFDITPTTGDVVAIVTVNGESKVKTFETANIAINATTGGGIQQYIATFPNVNVNVGDEYKACALLLADVGADNLICKTGFNSPAKRPEFIDLSLATGSEESSAIGATPPPVADEEEKDSADEEEKDSADEEEKDSADEIAPVTPPEA
ncbi:MAG TPA: hypothetical protein VKA98_04695 [Nitrososphaeraceae archaeon]|nr:hypothetical protein [Nitrososphaeraceae archaeon]